MEIIKSTIDKEGSCNFCSRGKLGPTLKMALIFPYETVYRVSAENTSGLTAIICEDCMQELKDVVI